VHETVAVARAVVGLSADSARLLIENEIWSASGEGAAVIRSSGGWLDLKARKLVIPPQALIDAMRRVPRTPDFVELPQSSKATPAKPAI